MSTTTHVLSPSELAEWLRAQRWSDFAQSLVRHYDRHGSLSAAQDAAARKMYAKVAARRAARGPATATADPVTPGFYLVDGHLWQVVRAQHGGLYAERRGDQGGWTFVRGAIRSIRPDQRVTAEQAVQHGLRTGVCLFCNAELDDREGLGAKVGVGPVCARKHLGVTQRDLAVQFGLL